MNLRYNGVNKHGRVEWLELDLASPFHPGGMAMEEWQVNRYRPFVEGIQASIGRDLTKEELRTVQWLSGYEKETVNTILGLIQAASAHGKASNNK